MRRFGFLGVVFCLLVVAVVGSQVSKSGAARTAITPAPAFTADEMNALPGNNWLSHMGNLAGTRYSSLTQINKSNVSTLKVAWQINLGTCPPGTKNASCGSLEANAVVYEGTYYFTTPKGEVFALDATTGAQLWKNTPTFEAGFNVGSGGRQPGVALAEGKVYVGTRDGYIKALDQTTGAQIWKTEVGPWRKGSKVSAAPIYANGIVLVGDSTGDNGGISASMHAYDAVKRPRAVDVDGRASPGSARWRHLAEERPAGPPLRRRLDVGVPARRHEARTRDLRYRQPEPVELPRARARTCGPTRSWR